MGTAKKNRALEVASDTRETPDVDDLIRRMQARDEVALEVFVKHYGREITGWTNNILHHHQDAGQVVNDVIGRVWRHIGKFQGRCSFTTWLFRITQRACFTFLEDQKKTGGQPQMTKEQAEKLLQAIQDEEQKTNQKVQQKQVKAVNVKVQKDW